MVREGLAARVRRERKSHKQATKETGAEDGKDLICAPFRGSSATKRACCKSAVCSGETAIAVSSYSDREYLVLNL